MSNDTTDFAGDVCRQLHDDGYSVHMGNTADGRELSGKHWFTWMKSGMSEAEVGPTCESELGAWSSALAHRIANSDIELSLVEGSAPQATMGPFFPARLPEAAFEVETIATRFGVTRDAAAAQVERLRRQSVYMNDLYQVNAQLVAAPFGAVAGDVMWLSIKRRDKAPVHDWRELQAVKNLIIGPEHEGFEVYPAESRLVDTANQYHLWVFLDPKFRLPVGFREREVMGADQAAAIGATQRDFEAAV